MNTPRDTAERIDPPSEHARGRGRDAHGSERGAGFAAAGDLGRPAGL